MKKTFLAILSSLFILFGLSFITLGRGKTVKTSKKFFKEDLSYQLHGWDTRLVKSEKLNEAKFIQEVIPGYPVNWITEHVSVQIQATCNGKIRTAVSASDTLSAEQKNLLKSLDLGTDIVVDVQYKYNNRAMRDIENNSIHTSVTIVPEIEAEYVGGNKQIMQYLKEKGINKAFEKIMEQHRAGINNVFEPMPLQPRQILTRFTVNEDGSITNSRIVKTSQNAELDKLVLDAINKMPKWKPAENSKGIKVKEEFEFSINDARIGEGGC